MKFTIQGSELASHLRPLRTIVRQNDEKDYDNIVLAISEEEDDRRCLRAAVLQPAYAAFLCLNLSGEKEGYEGIGGEPIDADAVACRQNEMWVFPASKLAACNRSVGQNVAAYCVADNYMDIIIDDQSKLHLCGKHRMEELDIPVFDNDNFSENEKQGAGHGLGGRLTGVFGENVLQKALFTALRVCKLGGKGSNPREQGIHLTIEGTRLTVEALSNTAEFAYTDPLAMTVPKEQEAMQPLHISISKDAATVLSDIATLTGNAVRWVYDEDEQLLTVWCEPYVMCITVEAVGCEVCDAIEPDQQGVAVDTRQLMRGVSRAKNAGSKVVFVKCLTTGSVELLTPDGSMDMLLDARTFGTLCSPRTLRMPVNALYAILGGMMESEVYISFRESGDVVIETDDGCICRLSEV